jgi:hypothetical protein
MSDDGHEPMPPDEFWKLVASQKVEAGGGVSLPPSDTDGAPSPPNDGSSVGAPPPVPPPKTGDSSLEERLRAAQERGLADNLRRQLAFVGAAEVVFEFQALGVRRYPNDSFDKSRAAHARGPEMAVALCAEADSWIAHGVYIMPARLRAGVESRHAAPGHWFDIPKGVGTTDSDVEARLILAVDFDVKRPSAISATEEEMQRSVRVAQNAWSFLAHHLGESSLAYLHSGNGRQIHIALDAVPVNDPSKNACAGLLVGLAHLFNTPEVTVDEKLFDAKRILPACGTLKKKGAAGVEDRPHRRTAIVTPEVVTRVSLEKLVELARVIWEASDAAGRAAIDKAFGVKPQPQATSVVTGMRDNPDSPFARANDVEPQQVADWLGLYNPRGEVVCPGCGETSGVAVLNRGLKCHHNRCKDRGRGGFRTNIDLVAEVQGLSPKEAVIAISDRFGLGIPTFHEVPPPAIAEAATEGERAAAVQQQQQDYGAEFLTPLDERLTRSVARAVRRWIGIEKPVPLPWDELKEHFGGGLWPGLHILCSGTGVGKTAAVLQICKHAAVEGVPTAYVGLEMDDLQFDLRVVAEEAELRWSNLYTGQTNNEALKRAATVALELADRKLPLHPINRNPMGWPASKVHALAAALRQKYPEPPPSETMNSGGPGSRPILIVLDYLQIIGPEEGEDGKYKTLDLRERIGRAAYALREVATHHNIAILVVASVARDKYGLWPMVMSADLRWDYDKDRLVNRRVTVPDVLVGLGKESGEIEYGADSVSVLSRVPDTYVDGQGESVVFVTAKGRATGARWTPMHFTGFRYEPARDGGDAVVEALSKADNAKEQKRLQKEEGKRQAEAEADQRRAAAADSKEQQRVRDRDACLRVVTQCPGIGSRQLRASMAAELGECGRERADAAITYCENVSHTITVNRINPKDLKHYPSGQYAPQPDPDGGDLSTDRFMLDGPKKSPIPPSDGATRATPGGSGGSSSATPATPATRGLTDGNYRDGGVAEPPPHLEKRSATPATPRQPTADEQTDADSVVLFDMDESEWRTATKALGWSEARSGRARALAKHRQSKARADGQALHHVELRGDDPRALATEWGWDDDRIRIAMRFKPAANDRKENDDG